MLLIYYRTYATHAFLGFLFGVDDSAVGRNINPLQPLLAGIFRIPERRIKLDPEEIRELFFDATERPTRRPAEGQRAFYSGKKKRHTLKNQVVTARRTKPPGPGKKPQRLRIAAVSESFPGSVHDKKVYDRTRAVRPARCEADGGHGLPRDAAGDARPQAQGGRVDGEPEGEEPGGVSSSDRGGARHRQDEGLADRLGAVSQPGPASHADHEERGRAAQPDVCLIDGREGEVTPLTEKTLLCSDSIECRSLMLLR